VAIDPAATAGDDADETGIVVAARGDDGHGYVLEDCSCRGRPAEWGRVAVDAYRRWHADRILGEGNNGGEMVEHVIRSIDARAAYTMVTASRAKRARAEPVSALYEQGRVHHVGTFEALEEQMVTWVPTTSVGSPDRLDALVWALSALLLTPLDAAAPVMW
jgi:phage terminase large subunit-like protein